MHADAIVRAINDAQALVVVLSASAIGSSHAGREIERAASKHKQIIALKIDAAPLTPALEYFLSESQWINVPALGMPAALARLTQAVGQGATRMSQANPVSGDGGAPGALAVSRVVGRTIVAKRAVFAAAVVIALSFVGALAIHFWPDRHPESRAPARTSSFYFKGKQTKIPDIAREARCRERVGRQYPAIRQSASGDGSVDSS